MFQRLPEASRQALTILLDGKPMQCCEGDSVAAALFVAGYTACRTTAVSGAARGPYCMTGVCYDCLVAIDGRPNQQACMVSVRPGMRVERQEGARAVRS
jgi:predicted molibdopterin-dependent oxidoreductase YjgC